MILSYQVECNQGSEVRRREFPAVPGRVARGSARIRKPGNDFFSNRMHTMSRQTDDLFGISPSSGEAVPLSDSIRYRSFNRRSQNGRGIANPPKRYGAVFHIPSAGPRSLFSFSAHVNAIDERGPSCKYLFPPKTSTTEVGNFRLDQREQTNHLSPAR